MREIAIATIGLQPWGRAPAIRRLGVAAGRERDLPKSTDVGTERGEVVTMTRVDNEIAEPGVRALRAFALSALGLLIAVPALAGGPAAGVGMAKYLTERQSDPILKASMKSRNSTAAATPTKPALVGTFGDWGVYVSQSAKSKICYALAQPKDRSPASLKRESAYVFISNRPGEGVRGEVSMIMGLPLKEGTEGGRAEIGNTKFELVAKGQNAFIKNAAEEGQFVDSLKRRGSRLTIRVASAKGQVATDTYSLAGLSPALDRVGKECP